MKSQILKLFTSSIKIKVTGRNPNIFLKKLIRNKINIYKVITLTHNELIIIINYKDLEKITKLKTIYQIEIIRYYGKLSLLKKIKKNIYIISFLILGLIIMIILSNIIFNIEIIHSNSNITKLVKESLEENGIKKYHFVKNYQELEKIKKKILEENKDKLEWLEITREGTKYIVRIEERIINKEEQDNKIYNIVSSKGAIIKRIEANSGEKVKDLNTYVKKGETIISSQITLPSGETIQKSASGKILGEVWYTIRVEYPYTYKETLYTGNKKKVLSLYILNKRISFLNFHKYKTFNKNTKYLYQNPIIPLSIAYEYEYETKEINDIYTYETAKEKALNLAKKKLLEKHTQIEDITKVLITNEEDQNTKILLDLFITCNEDITSYQEKIE